MRVLVVGSGGREHALAWKLAQEGEVFAAPGNPGIAEVAECCPVSASDTEGIVSLAGSLKSDLVVVGPEYPLIAGLADALRQAGNPTFGPGASAARLEGSKAFAKEMMDRAGVPTAAFRTCTDPSDAIDFSKQLFSDGKGVAVKASGAALGKGVVVCDRFELAEEAIRSMMVERAFGPAGDTVVIEQRLAGREFSLIAICSGGQFVSLPIAQDHKRILDGDRGPNTGGMGTYSPVSWVSEELLRQTEREVIAPILATLEKDDIDFRGTLFAGLMVEDGRPYCLEYNVRFGDPETQTQMLRLGGGLLHSLFAVATGGVPHQPEVKENAIVTVVLASGGYPGSYEKGIPIEMPAQVPDNVQIFHAGTAMKDGMLVTAGGRVLAVTAEALSIPEARSAAYKVAGQIRFDGKQYRTDIAG